MAVEKVVLFRSADGVLHESEQACLFRNFAIDSRPKLMTSLTSNAVCLDKEPGVFSAEAICDWVLKCTPEILSILTPLVVPVEPPRRGRRTKAEMALDKAAQAVLQSEAGTKSSPTEKTQSLNDFAAKEAQLLGSVPAPNAKVDDKTGELELESTFGNGGINA